MKGLIIKDPYADYILDGKKTWELRGSNTHIRGRVAIIKSGTKQVFGTVNLCDCLPVTLKILKNFSDRHCVKDLKGIKYKQVFAWVVKDPHRYSKPKSYIHPNGAVVWVNLKE